MGEQTIDRGPHGVGLRAFAALPHPNSFGRHFLVRTGGATSTLGPLRTVEAPAVTSSPGEAPVRALAPTATTKLDAAALRALVEDAEATLDPLANTIITVFPLVRRPASTFAFVSIGRVEGNDVALADASVSKFHAFVKDGTDGLWLQDARSKNGCTVNGAPVAARGHGLPTRLVVGQRVVFGSVPTTFLDVDGVLALARRLFR